MKTNNIIMEKSWFEKIFELAREAGLNESDMPKNIKLGLDISKLESSLYGEKTSNSIMEKVVHRITNDNLADYTIGDDMPDLIRCTLHLPSHENIPLMLDILKHKYPDMSGEFQEKENRNYRCTKVGSTIGGNGFASDIHIKSWEQAIVDCLTHKLNKLAEKTSDSEKYKALMSKMKEMNDILWENINHTVTDEIIKEKLSKFGGLPKNNLREYIAEKRPTDLHMLRQPTYNKLSKHFNIFELRYQAEIAQAHAQSGQKALLHVCGNAYSEFSETRD